MPSEIFRASHRAKPSAKPERFGWSLGVAVSSNCKFQNRFPVHSAWLTALHCAAFSHATSNHHQTNVGLVMPNHAKPASRRYHTAPLGRSAAHLHSQSQRRGHLLDAQTEVLCYTPLSPLFNGWPGESGAPKPVALLNFTRAALLSRAGEERRGEERGNATGQVGVGK